MSFKAKDIKAQMRIYRTLVLRIKGLTDNEIAEKLGVSPRQVREYRKYIREHPEEFDLPGLRYYNWVELEKDMPELTPWQRAQIRRDLLRSLEPIQVREKKEVIELITGVPSEASGKKQKNK